MINCMKRWIRERILSYLDRRGFTPLRRSMVIRLQITARPFGGLEVVAGTPIEELEAIADALGDPFDDLAAIDDSELFSGDEKSALDALYNPDIDQRWN